MRARAAILVLFLALALPVLAQEHPSLAQARVHYNAAEYPAAIAAADVARADPAAADAAALVAGRAYLQRYRSSANPADLVAARASLAAVRPPALSPRDRLDLLIGLGQALYHGDVFGGAAELFETALDGADLLDETDRLALLDWWATALDRTASERPPDGRGVVYERLMWRMEDELRSDPGSPVANYWVSVAAHGAGSSDRAWDAAVAGWVRAVLRPASTDRLREDLDRFVTTVLIFERANARPAEERSAARDRLQADWELVKAGWR